MNNAKIDYVKRWQGCVSVVEVAKAYFPGYTRSDRAVKQFRLKIKNSPKMLNEMQEEEYDPLGKFLTPAQMEIIIRHWKLPGNINHLAEQ
ncbi:MAG: DUF4248 domain-containing protein [Bacteroides sp.]|nr:DUF4248 domain-containing protein [Bacteroides sp.]